MKFIPPQKTGKNDPITDIIRTQSIIMEQQNTLAQQNQCIFELLQSLIDKIETKSIDVPPTGIYTEVGK